MNNKINAAEFTKYVETQRADLFNILKGKDVALPENPALGTLVRATSQLAGPEKIEDSYQYDSFLKRIIDEYEADPLLERNGGQYKYCLFEVFSTDYPTTYFLNGAEHMVFSDGTVASTGQAELLHEWNTEKDSENKLDDGTNVRWIKFYNSTTTKFQPSLGYPEKSISDSHENTLILCIHDSSFSAFAYSDSSPNSKRDHNRFIKASKLKIFVFGYSCTWSSSVGLSGRFIYGCPKLEVIKSFKKVASPGEGKMVGDCENLRVFDILLGSDTNAPTLVEGVLRYPLIINENMLAETKTYTSSEPCFSKFANLPVFPEGFSLSKGLSVQKTFLGNLYDKNVKTTFLLGGVLAYGGDYIKRVIIEDGFTNNDSNIYLPSLPNITEDAIEEIFTRLGSLPEGTTRTITFYTRIYVKNSILEIASSKGWTVSGLVGY